MTQQQQQQQPPPVDVRRDFFASWAAFAAGMTAAYPIDTLRVRWQCLGQTPRQTLAKDGLRTLYAGAAVPLAVMGPVVAAQFAAFETVKPHVAASGWLRHGGDPAQRTVSPLSMFGVLPESKYSVAETFAAGTIAGAGSVFIVTPITVVRIRQQNAACSSSGCQQALPATSIAADIFRREGVRGLWRANGAMAAMNGIGRGIYFGAYEWAKHVATAGDPEAATAKTTAGAAFVATASWLLFAFPLDLVMTRVMANPLRCPGGVVAEGSRIVRASGWRAGLYQGFSLALMRSTIWSGIQLPMYDLLRGAAMTNTASGNAELAVVAV